MEIITDNVCLRWLTDIRECETMDDVWDVLARLSQIPVPENPTLGEQGRIETILTVAHERAKSISAAFK